MSTNYYITHRAAIDAGVPIEWLQQVHIAQYAEGGFMLQAINGRNGFDNTDIPEDLNTSHAYYAPVEIDSVTNWDQMRELLRDETYVIVDEYGVVIDSEEFIADVETQENGADHRYHRNTAWFEDMNENIFDRTDYIDENGFVFEIREFF